uniref:5'-nucleotidase, cytosolic IB n=1 Tax=Macaca mulatta TaxID=9544 RepID=F7CDZ6_MACMU
MSQTSLKQKKNEPGMRSSKESLEAEKRKESDKQGVRLSNQMRRAVNPNHSLRCCPFRGHSSCRRCLCAAEGTALGPCRTIRIYIHMCLLWEQGQQITMMRGSQESSLRKTDSRGYLVRSQWSRTSRSPSTKAPSIDEPRSRNTSAKALQYVNARLRDLYPDEQDLFDIVLMTNNHAQVGVRLINSVNHYGLLIDRFCLTGGKNPIGYLKAYLTNLYIAADSEKVQEAIQEGIASATMFDGAKDMAYCDTQLRVAFDGDAVLFSDESEHFTKEHGLDKFFQYDTLCESKPLAQEEPRLDVLINNAGIFQCPYMKTEDGFEMQFGVNHLGHFLLTNLLLGLLKSSAPSRIVVVSSKLYKYGDINFDDLNSEQSYNKSFCYSRSKLANILFTRELARRLEGTNVTVNVLHPGIVRTNLGRHIHIPLLVRPLFNLVSWAFFKTPVEGAQTSIYLASSPEVEGVSGRYFGDCKEEELLPKALDESVARKLWDISEVMVGLLK